MKLSKIKKGFTLIEILLVVAILSILLVVVFAALNPATRLADTRDARRWNDVNQILTAVHECLVDNEGVWATCGITVDANNDMALSQLGTCATGGATPCAGAADACLNLTSALGDYMASIPRDPLQADGTTTGYSMQVSNGIVTVASCQAEGDTIQVAR